MAKVASRCASNDGGSAPTTNVSSPPRRGASPGPPAALGAPELAGALGALGALAAPAGPAAPAALSGGEAPELGLGLGWDGAAQAAPSSRSSARQRPADANRKTGRDLRSDIAVTPNRTPTLAPAAALLLRPLTAVLAATRRFRPGIS